MDFKELIKRTLHVNGMFEKQMDIKARMLDLVEEVGESANAMLMVGNRNTYTFL